MSLVTTPAIAAAFRLATTLPVHVHRRREPVVNMKPPTQLTLWRREQVRAWLQEKPRPSTGQMARRLGVTRRSVQDHVKHIREETTTRRTR